MVDRASLESTKKSIIVPSTNMGYLGSLKNPKLLYILRHSSVTAVKKIQFNMELLFQLRELVIKYSMLLDQRNINI